MEQEKSSWIPVRLTADFSVQTMDQRSVRWHIQSAKKKKPGWVNHHLRSEVRDHLDQQGETLSLLKIKTSQVWWCMPIIPATREAEAGELLEPRKQRLRWTEIMPLHSSLGNNSETPSQKKKKPYLGQAWRFTPVIPALWEAKAGGSPEVRSLRLAWPTWQNPVSSRNSKIS